MGISPVAGKDDNRKGRTKPPFPLRFAGQAQVSPRVVEYDGYPPLK
jgi:hypothetical protein